MYVEEYVLSGAVVVETPSAVAPPNSITAVTTSHTVSTDLPTITGPATRLFSVTTDGSGQRQVLNIPNYAPDFNSQNGQMIGRRVTITCGTLTNGSDKVVITVNGSYGPALTPTSFFVNSGDQYVLDDSSIGGVILQHPGDTASFLWNGVGWEWDVAAAYNSAAAIFASSPIGLHVHAAYGNLSGASIEITAGPSTGSGDGGNLYLQAGSSDSGNAGAVTIRGGHSPTGGAGLVGIYSGAGDIGAELIVTTGEGYSGSGGSIVITQGNTTGNHSPGAITITTGFAPGNHTKSGGDINLTAVNSASYAGGNIHLTVGSGTGNIVLTGLPTSGSGLASGALYNSSGNLKIKP